MPVLCCYFRRASHLLVEILLRSRWTSDRRSLLVSLPRNVTLQMCKWCVSSTSCFCGYCHTLSGRIVFTVSKKSSELFDLNCVAEDCLKRNSCAVFWRQNHWDHILRNYTSASVGVYPEHGRIWRLVRRWMCHLKAGLCLPWQRTG